MAESVVSFVLERVGDLLNQEAIFLGGVRRQVEEMKRELQRMQRFLKDADERQDKDETVQGWVSEIREVAYDAEDVIETFALEVASRKGRGFQKKCKRYASIFIEGAKLYKVGNEVEAIKRRISSLTSSLQTYGIKIKEGGEGTLSSSVLNMQRQLLRRSYSHLVEEHTVGLDKSINVLVEQLVNIEERHCQVVSICGMGGLGKTTLANKLYHHGEVRRHFDAFSWACISQQFQARIVWEGILINLLSPTEDQKKKIVNMRDEEIAKKLYQVQQQKKCLVILDDIWTAEAWDALKPAFSIGKAAGRILLTTRNKVVAMHVDSRGFLHEPRTLTEEESWELLQNKTFFADLRINTDMENLGRIMVKRCSGLPLAIIVLGGLLATKHSLNEWKKVHENIGFYLRRGKGKDQEFSGVYGALALSYHELPYQLKPCFLHLAQFPEDYDIPTKKLFRLWVAEGLVSQYMEGTKTVEELAECYLGELVDRCMVQVKKTRSTGGVKTCRLHDLMRDLCLSKARQENFLEIVHHGQIGNAQPVSTRVRRLAVYAHEDSDPRYYERTPYLRSLLFFKMFKSEDIGFPKMISTFSYIKLLRILTLDGCEIDKNLVKEIGNLIHLRYLALEKCKIKSIPSSIGNLSHLQTLVVRADWWAPIEVPNVIWKLARLRHLHLWGFRTANRNGKLRLDNLKELQILRGIDTRKFDLTELDRLGNLKKVEILYLKSFKEFDAILKPQSASFNRLHSLVIRFATTCEEIDLKKIFSRCHNLYKQILEGKIEKLPEYQHFPPTLADLTLAKSELGEDPMGALEKLPNLSSLCLGLSSFTGNKIVCSSKGFPRLKTLTFIWLLDLEEWQVDEEAMPSLCLLRISSCDKLKMVPDGLRFTNTLRELEIRHMPEAFNNRFRVVNGGGEDLYKVQHVPSIILISDSY